MTLKESVILFKALSDETRLKIIAMLQQEPLCACKLLTAFSLSQPTLSYHLNVLVKSGLLKAQKDGIWMHYSLNAARFLEVVEFLAVNVKASQEVSNIGCK